MNLFPCDGGGLRGRFAPPPAHNKAQRMVYPLAVPFPAMKVHQALAVNSGTQEDSKWGYSPCLARTNAEPVYVIHPAVAHWVS